MTGREYWYRLVRANAGLRDESTKITMSVKSFREQVEKAFQEGADSAEESAPSDDSMDFFRGIFGKKRGEK
jgi:hypothetical protein